MAQVRETATTPKKRQSRHVTLGLTDQEVVEHYRKMVVTRTLDERVSALNRQGKAPITASCQGHEAAQIGSAIAIIKSGDYFVFPYYRDVALKLALGDTPLEIMLGYQGKLGGPWSEGRQFAMQGAHLKHKMIQISNVVAAGLTQAVGYALACKMLGEKTVVLAYMGDGATSEGECHEAMNFAGIHKLPVVFICENNKYAISVPLPKQMAIENVADRAAGYGFPGIAVDGLALFAVFRATRDAIERARRGAGPTFIEAKVERYMPHTSDDDDRRYRSREEIEQARKRDPLNEFKTYLVAEGVLTEAQDKELRDKVLAEIDEATELSEKAPFPDPSTFYDHLYAS